MTVKYLQMGQTTKSRRKRNFTPAENWIGTNNIAWAREVPARLVCFGYSARLEADGADIAATHGAAIANANFLDVGQEPTLRFVVCVADVIACSGTFATNRTLSHDN